MLSFRANPSFDSYEKKKKKEKSLVKYIEQLTLVDRMSRLEDSPFVQRERKKEKKEKRIKRKFASVVEAWHWRVWRFESVYVEGRGGQNRWNVCWGIRKSGSIGSIAACSIWLRKGWSMTTGSDLGVISRRLIRRDQLGLGDYISVSEKYEIETVW